MSENFQVLHDLTVLFGDEAATEIYLNGQNGIDQLESRNSWYADWVYYGRTGDNTRLMRPLDYKAIEVVDPQTFVEDPYYLNAKNILYPEVMLCFVEMNGDNYDELVLTGAIGTGKTTLAIYTTAYQLYLLSMQRNPHQLLGLDPASEITFIFQSLNATLAKSVDYDRFKTMIQKSPYFAENFAFDKNIESELKFPNRIIVKPVSGADTAAIGQNVIGGVIDEMNFMALVNNSKHSIDGTTYDQALAVYNSISRRRKSRFMKGGVLPGKLCLVSSKRYPGQFTDQKEEESKKELALYGKTNIYVYDKRAWDIKPEGTFSGKWFNIYIGNEYKKARVIEVGEAILVDDLPYILAVPEEYRTEFETDMMNALRDIAGVSTLATHPYMLNMDAVSACFDRRKSVLSREYANFVDLQLEVYPDNIMDKDQPRFAHVDLGLTGDSAGVCVGYVDRFETAQRGGTIESMPHINIDLLLEVQPPKGGEILFYKIRDLFYALRTLGCDIRWITFDTFQSADSIQILRQQGFAAGVQSVDVTIVPYELTKQAFYDDRVAVPVHKKAMREIASLEKDVKRGKVDHPPNGCGVYTSEIMCYDGVVRTLGQLTEEYEATGKTHLGFAWDIQAGVERVVELQHPRITKEVTELVEVTLANGKTETYTPEHLFLLKDGTYKQAQSLEEGDELQD